MAYRKLVKDMCLRYPNLEYLSYELNEAPRGRDPCGKAMALELHQDSVQTPQPMDPEKLKEYLDERDATTSTLIVLEDIATDFVEILGLHLDVNPFFFAKHLRTTNWVRGVAKSEAMPPPSICDYSRSFSLQYPDLYVFDGPERDELRATKVYSKGNVFRRIAFPGATKEAFDGVGVISRRISFWSSDASKIGLCPSSRPISYTFTDKTCVIAGLLLVDPPIDGYVVSNRPLETYYAHPDQFLPRISVQPKCYKGGYIDPYPWPNSLIRGSEIAGQGPGRISLFEDLRSYYFEPNRRSQRWEDASFNDITHLIQRIAFSHWTNLPEYIQETASVMEYNMEHFQME
jgi:hypothetical protein